MVDRLVQADAAKININGQGWRQLLKGGGGGKCLVKNQIDVNENRCK